MRLMKAVYPGWLARNLALLLIRSLCCALIFLTMVPAKDIPAARRVSPADPRIQYNGRFDQNDPEAPTFAWTGSSILFRVDGTGFKIFLEHIPDSSSQHHSNYYFLIVDDSIRQLVKTTPGQIQIDGGNDLTKAVHTVQLYRRTEAFCGVAVFSGLELPSGTTLLEPPARPQRRIEFIGNSITCGYGDEATSPKIHFSPETEDGYRSYAAVASRELRAEYHIVAFSGRGVYRNYDLSIKGLMPELYKLYYPQSERQWDFTSWTPDVVVINLGTNDFAKGIPDSSGFVKAYSGLLRQVRSYYSDAVIVCLDGPMLTGKPLQKCHSFIESAVNTVLEEGKKQIYTFSLTTQGPLGMGADYHPNIAQHALNARELTRFIAEKMNW